MEAAVGEDDADLVFELMVNGRVDGVIATESGMTVIVQDDIIPLGEILGEEVGQFVFGRADRMLLGGRPFDVDRGMELGFDGFRENPFLSGIIVPTSACDEEDLDGFGTLAGDDGGCAGDQEEGDSGFHG